MDQKSFNILEKKTTFKEVIQDVIRGVLVGYLHFDKEKNEVLIRQSTEVISEKAIIILSKNKNKNSLEEITKAVVETTILFIEDFLENLNNTLSEEEKRALLRTALEKITKEGNF